MEIKTRFNLKQHVWYMKDNKPVEVVISAIKVFVVGTNQDIITYNATDVFRPVTWLDHTKLPEYALHATKEKLLRSLFSDVSLCKGIELGDGNFSGCSGTGGDCPVCGK